MPPACLQRCMPARLPALPSVQHKSCPLPQVRLGRKHTARFTRVGHQFAQAHCAKEQSDSVSSQGQTKHDCGLKPWQRASGAAAAAVLLACVCAPHALASEVCCRRNRGQNRAQGN